MQWSSETLKSSIKSFEKVNKDNEDYMIDTKVGMQERYTKLKSEVNEIKSQNSNLSKLLDQEVILSGNLKADINKIKSLFSEQQSKENSSIDQNDILFTV